MISPLNSQAQPAPTFHKAGPLRSLSEQSVWRTLAGYPGGIGTNDGAGVVARFSEVSGIAVDTFGIAYVADSGNHVIRKIDPTGIVTTFAGDPGVSGYRDGAATSALFNLPGCLAIGADGSLFVGDPGNGVIRRIDSAGAVTTVVAKDAAGNNVTFTWESCLACGGGGDIYVADGGVIRKVDPAGIVSIVAGNPEKSGFLDGTGTNALFGQIGGLAVDGSETLYVADTGNNAIRKVSPEANVSTLAGGTRGYRHGEGTYARFAGLNGLAADSEGNVYVTEDYGRIRRISPQGEVSTLGGHYTGWWRDYADGLGPFARFSSPSAIGVSPAGHLLVLDSGNSVVRRGSLGYEAHSKILMQPVNQTGQVGASVALAVVAQADTPLTYQWLANAQPIAGATHASLRFDKLQPADAGDYQVAVSDGIGYILSSVASLQVSPATNHPSSPLNKWRRLASAPLQQIQCLAYGNGRYVAIGGAYGSDSGSVASSIDGEHWVKEFPVTSENLNGVAFGNGYFVAVGNRATLLTSTNGVDWEGQNLTPEGTPDLQAVVFDQGVFVAVSGDRWFDENEDKWGDANGSIWCSPDGINWNNRGVGFGDSFMTVAAGGGRFIAAGNTIMTSTNGLEWEPVNVPTNYLGTTILLEHVAFGNGTFLATEAPIHPRVLTASATGLDWQDLIPTNGLVPSGVCWGNGRFLASDTVSGGVTTSADGIDWETPTPVTGGGLRLNLPYVQYAQGLFVATGGDARENVLFTSADGKSWTAHEESAVLPFIPDRIVTVNGQYFAGAWSEPIETSTNGSNWHLLFATNSFNDLGYGDGTLVVIGDSDRVLSSPDGGTTWTERSPSLSDASAWPRLMRIAYGKGTFVAVGSVFYRDRPKLSGQILASEDGAVTWRTASLPPRSGDDDVYDVVYGNGVFLVLRAYTRSGATPTYEVLTSSNGLSWRSASTFPTKALNSIAFGNGQFVVGTDQGMAMTSPNGTTWQQHALPGVSFFHRVVFGNGLFLAWVSTTAEEPGGLWSSVDGFRWAKCGGVAASFTGPVAIEGRFLAVGGGGIYESSPIERLINPRRLPNLDLEWTVKGAPNIDYRIECSGDLRNWQTLEEVTNAPVSRPFLDPDAATHACRFYRVVTQ